MSGNLSYPYRTRQSCIAILIGLESVKQLLATLTHSTEGKVLYYFRTEDRSFEPAHKINLHVLVLVIAINAMDIPSISSSRCPSLRLTIKLIGSSLSRRKGPQETAITKGRVKIQYTSWIAPLSLCLSSHLLYLLAGISFNTNFLRSKAQANQDT